METLLRAADLAPDDLMQLLGSLCFPEEFRPRAWLEGVYGWSLDYWPGLGGRMHWYRSGFLPEEQEVMSLFPQLSSGRVFTPLGELRWRRLPALGANSCRTLYLGIDLPSISRLPLRHELADKSSRKEEYPLWGVMTPPSSTFPGRPEWVELSIPHRFRYPVLVDGLDGRVAVKVVMETWIDRMGQPHFRRFCDLQAYRGE